MFTAQKLFIKISTFLMAAIFSLLLITLRARGEEVVERKDSLTFSSTGTDSIEIPQKVWSNYDVVDNRWDAIETFEEFDKLLTALQHLADIWIQGDDQQCLTLEQLLPNNQERARNLNRILRQSTFTFAFRHGLMEYRGPKDPYQSLNFSRDSRRQDLVNIYARNFSPLRVNPNNPPFRNITFEFCNKYRTSTSANNHPIQAETTNDGNSIIRIASSEPHPGLLAVVGFSHEAFMRLDPRMASQNRQGTLISTTNPNQLLSPNPNDGQFTEAQWYTYYLGSRATNGFGKEHYVLTQMKKSDDSYLQKEAKAYWKENINDYKFYWTGKRTKVFNALATEDYGLGSSKVPKNGIWNNVTENIERILSQHGDQIPMAELPPFDTGGGHRAPRKEGGVRDGGKGKGH